MKRTKKLFLIAAILTLLVLTVVGITLTASAETYNGTCGTNVTWELDTTTGELTISGTGEMEDYDDSIPYYPPWNSYFIKTVTIADGVTSIGSCAFCNCYSLTSINIPDSVTSIGDYAFFSCSSLKSITISDNVTSIGVGPFAGCSSLMTITVDASNSNYTSIDGILYNKDITTLILYSDYKTDTSFNVPNSVTNIGAWAFDGCSSLTSITIPDSVTSIDHCAFDGCTNLIQNENGVYYVDKWAIDCDRSVTTVTLRENTVGIGAVAFSNCDSLTSITIPNSVKSIGYRVFERGSSLTKIIYCGTSTEWDSISKGWDTENGTYTLQYHSYVDGICEYCGEVQLAINNVNIAIGQDIIVNYYAMVPDSYTNLTMQFQMGDKTATVAGVATDVANQYVFAFEGVSPQCMGDAITAKLYSGTDLIAEKSAYTVKAYLEALINGDFDENTKAIAKDTLVYGGAAQAYKNYNTDALVSDGITGSSYTLPSKSGIELSNGAGATFTNATVWFDNINKIRVKFTADSTENLIVKINGTEAEYVLGDDGKYHVHTEALLATEFDKFFTFEIYINGTLVSSLKYSVNSYVYTMLSSTNEPMKNLAIALYNYGYSADIYNGTPQTPMLSEEEAAKADPTKSFQGEEHLFTPFG